MSFEEREKKCNEYLKFLAQLAKENPNTNFKSTEINQLIYKTLVRIGVDHSDLSVNLKDRQSLISGKPNYSNHIIHPQSSFGKWIGNFESKSTNVFVDNNWSYFCQFISKDKTAQNAKEHLKVYIPLDSKHIDRGADMIFSFLEANNISHISKIGKNIRFDDIVIRLTNSKDLELLLNYVRSNQYISQGLINPNPFAYNKDGIALAIDGSLSYNDTVAGLIALYIEDRKKYHLLNQVSYEDFNMYINDLYRREFVERRSSEFAQYFEIDSEQKLNNYKQVFSLIKKANTKEFNYGNLKDHYEMCLKENVILNRKEIDLVNRELLEAIDLMIKRFNVRDGIYCVEDFYRTGNPLRLTRTNNLRERLVNSSFRSNLHKILNTEKISFIEYAYRVMDYYKYDPNEVVVRK